MRMKTYSVFDSAISAIAAAIAKRIKNRDLIFSPIERRDIVQKNGKRRKIGVEGMIQQFCDYAAVYGLKELFQKKFGYSQFACIPGRGQFGGMKVVKKWLKNAKATRYCMQCDIEKCYDNISHEVVMRNLRQCVKNDDLLYLIETLIATHGDGLLIGSYLSPFLCNFLMSYAWHYMYEQRNDEFNHMATYIDDVILLGGNKRKLQKAYEALRDYVRERFGLRFKPTAKLYRVAYIDKRGKLRGQPIDFMGFRFTRFNVTVRKRVFLTIWRLVCRIKHGRFSKHTCRGLASLHGWVKNTDCWKFKVKHLGAFECAFAAC